MDPMENREWAAGDLVWFDPGIGHWLPGEVLECHKSANVLTIQALINNKPQTFALTNGEGMVRLRQDLGTSGVEDMTQLSDLHEAALLWNLKLRYDRNCIYTYAGSILIAVNPYRTFDSAYGIESAKRYDGKLLGALPPHLFALGAAAYAALPAPQVVVISGESGSGKTESIKLVMQYLAAIASNSNQARAQAMVTEQILEAAPLLEAFGNARTAKNDNSSRFGKYLEVYFKRSSIAGARVTQYLLEKSRIVSQAPGERNYHVFYELLGGLTSSEKQKYGLVAADKYFYLNQGGGDCSPGHTGSSSDWGALSRAMQVLGVGESEQEGIVKILAAVLHLGNVYFHRRQLRNGQEGVEVGSDVEIKWAAHLLQISPGALQRALTSRITETRNERVYSPLSIDQALDARDAFAKALYSALFNWLVSRVNSIVQRGGLHDASRISLLDIFGFENLAENSFEQLCINFASESLQIYFNKHVFKLEQQEYIKERLEWTNLTWNDNVPVLHLLGKKPVGILHLLDDESNFPRASDTSFLEKCHYNHALNEHYCRPRVGGREFGIRHYAGQVWYSVDGFLDKNRDALRPEIIELLASSKEALVSDIAKPLVGQTHSKNLPRGANGRFITMKPRTPTVAARFCDSLQQLLESMSRCNPWFVRCIKPNNDKSPMRFDMPVVLEQLRYTGLLDTIRIRQSGYPIRMKFQEFVDRYRYLLPGRVPRGAPYRDLCRAILESMRGTKTAGPDYQLGATRVFLREALQRQLEVSRGDQVRDAALVIQKNVRSYLARKKFANLKRSAIAIQKHWKGHKQRKQYQIIRNGIVKAQALHRGRLERKRFRNRKAEFKRRVEAEKMARHRREQMRQQELKREREQQQKMKARSTSVQHLEIPAELAFVFSKLDSYTPVHAERNLVKVIGGVSGQVAYPSLPNDLNQFEFAKFTSVYFKGSDLGMKKEPIGVPFLSKAAARDQDFQDAIALFKLILRWTNDPQLTGARERALADYIVQKGISSRGLRDELLVQLVNQSWRNENADRVWLLMSHCLSSFQPSPALSKYLLKYVGDHSPAAYRELLQRKLLRGLQKFPHARTLPPSLLEWKTNRQRSNMALPLTLSDGNLYTVSADSWTTCEEAATVAATTNLGIQNCSGWSVILDDAGAVTDCNGTDYIFDLVSELELCPSFPTNKSQILKAGVRNTDMLVQSPILRPQVPPPEPPTSSRKVSMNNQRKISSQEDYGETRQMTSTPARKSSHEALSRSSALNERYFDIEKVRSRSLDNLLSEPEATNLSDLGLSQSRLNDRYHSVEQLGPIKPVLAANSNYKDYKDEMDFEYPDVSSVNSNSNRRYIKSQYSGKKAPPGSHSSRAHIEKSEFGVRSSAMSDTSEAPSLASHVRRVRVPSQASDVDQFLDELFSPVLDGNLDELSDARSLAASIKGGGNKSRPNVDKEVENITARGVDDYISDLFSPIFVSDNISDLTQKHNLVEAIKGGGSNQPNGSNVVSTPQPLLMMNSQNDSFQMFNLPPGQGAEMNYPANLQRAFLQSAMAQNIQIQQQLLAQNQALQQLLTQNQDVPDNARKSSFNKARKSISPSDYNSRKISAEIRSSGVPPPPPMPPPIEGLDPSGTRPFLDPYGRAKTVRIGKWRWPPPKGGDVENGEDFMAFKMRQNQRKITPSRETNGSYGNEWEDVDFEPLVHTTVDKRVSSKRSFDIGANRPTPGSVGKLKLSSEMRQRLEQVTAHHSIRSTSSNVEKPARVVNKLEDTRKMMLEQQLGGRWADSVEDVAISGPPSPVPQKGNWSNWKPGPPPPPIGPSTLPPAPSGPAPPPPVRPIAQTAESFMAQRQERDTFGVHQNKVSMMNNSKRNSFSANWDSSNLSHDVHDDLKPRKDSWDESDAVHRSSRKISDSTSTTDRPTFRTHQYKAEKQYKEHKEKKSSVSTLNTENGTEWPEFMRPIKTPPVSKSPVIERARDLDGPTTGASRLIPLGSAACITYNRVPWSLRVRKEYFTPGESLGAPNALHLIFCQIASDVFGLTTCIRLSPNERRAGVSMLSGYGVGADNITANHRANVKRQVVELARTWPLYFSRFFQVSGAAQLSEVQLLAVSHWGIHLVKSDGGILTVLRSISLKEITSCSAPRPTTVNVDTHNGRISLHSTKAQQLSEMVTKFLLENRKVSSSAAKSPTQNHHHQQQHRTSNGNAAVVVGATESVLQARGVAGSEETAGRTNGNGQHSPGSPLPPSGRYSLLQFAMQNFRQTSELELLKVDSSLKSKEKRKEWTWKQQTDLVKWQNHPIDGPLLKLEDPELIPLAVECFECILRYSGDLPLTPEMSEVKCVYTVLMHCHKHFPLRDEVYCQLMKQTTSNKSDSPESCQRAWRLLSIIAAYFACSEMLNPFLMEHLSGAASDRRRICHGTAAVCLANLRKTQRCGGRKNVPSVEEVTAVSAGRSARRQIYRLPGGAERVVNTRCSTVVGDVIAELCTLIGVTSEAEQQEFSLYCIVQGDAFTMPLAADEYILDVTTELHKAAQPFYLIFCRSVWYHGLKQHDASPLYTEVLFNQVAPDYLEGLLLRLANPNMPPSIVRDMAMIAALLHRAADLNHSPTLKEVKFLLPKPVLGLREPRPPQWLALVQTSWAQVQALPVSRAKHKVLQVLSNWQLFGSSFFAVKRVLGDVDNWQEHILALNRTGVHFLDMTTHETLQHWPYAEVISTRKVRSEDGALFLDMKCGNLLQQRVTRLQTEQAHEISRLVRQYITLEQANSNNSPRK